MLKLAPSYKMSFIEYPDRNEWCTTLYTVGCPHNCRGCHNEALKNKDYDIVDMFTNEELISFMFELAEKSQSDNFTIIGGEPLAPWNIDGVRELLLSKAHDFNICIYTGYDIEHVKKLGLKGFKYLKTGKYDERYINLAHDSVELSSDFTLTNSYGIVNLIY
jgi:organic radical activating enzyme